ncbi:uncharacterized protein G2W53_013148 [Senna tora]|uniref:Uncharacterized protein n=1 Tax=Senna tora TaxID=362788 RepID=A0A834U216_9FABA|nr:uncharacterized protein G2W53_013148 [Senna tora]
MRGPTRAMWRHLIRQPPHSHHCALFHVVLLTKLVFSILPLSLSSQSTGSVVNKRMKEVEILYAVHTYAVSFTQMEEAGFDFAL